MTIKWKRSSDRTEREYDIGEVIRVTVDDAPDYHDGYVEILKARLDKLMQIVSTAIASMPDEVQRTVVEENCYQFFKGN